MSIPLHHICCPKTLVSTYSLLPSP
jgi:hypothetical protein